MWKSTIVGRILNMINIYDYIKFFATQNYKQQEACRECWKEKQLETFVVTPLATFIHFQAAWCLKTLWGMRDEIVERPYQWIMDSPKERWNPWNVIVTLSLPCKGEFMAADRSVLGVQNILSPWNFTLIIFLF